jgi:phosphate starvation-inducible PhoH-like protein
MADRGRRIELTLEETDRYRLANLCGPIDAHLSQIGNEYAVRITRRGNRFSIEGEAIPVQHARLALMHFHALAHEPLSPDEIQLGLVELRSAEHGLAEPSDVAEAEPGGSRPLRPVATPDESPVLHTRRADLQGRTPRQREYLRNILGHDITFGIGPAGTGKTYLAVACAVDALERDAVRRIVLTRPAVEAGERLGFLPGDLAQKVDPYLRPLYDALYDLMGLERTARMFEKQAIEIAPLAYMRGRTLNHSSFWMRRRTRHRNR